jgi:hypothetical protein
MDKGDVVIFPDAATGRAASSIDPALLMAIQNNGGFGGNGFWWIILMWMMWQRNGGNGSFQDYLAQQNGSEGRQYLAEIMNGRFDNLGNLANILNTSVSTLQSMLFTIQSNVQTVGANVNLTAAQTQNAIAMGNAALGRQLCECCCENRLAICQQTNTLQAQAAENAANVRLQLAQNEAADQLSVCQQTNTLTRQADGNTNSILGAIQAQTTMITKEFCDLKERELQNKINTQGDIITQLRNQISNDKQTLQFNAAFHAIDDKIDAIAAKQPNTVPVQYPNLTAVNNTPYVGQGYYPGGYPGFGWNNWNNGFGGGIIF